MIAHKLHETPSEAKPEAATTGFDRSAALLRFAEMIASGKTDLSLLVFSSPEIYLLRRFSRAIVAASPDERPRLLESFGATLDALALLRSA